MKDLPDIKAIASLRRDLESIDEELGDGRHESSISYLNEKLEATRDEVNKAIALLKTIEAAIALRNEVGGMPND